MSRTLAVCADDFGQAPGTSAVIAELAGAGRLTAIACIANSPHWADAARLLRGLPAAVDVGLHLNLTDGVPASAALAARWPRLPGIGRLLLGAHLGRLPLAAIGAELDAQLAAFRGAVGVPPAFIDGHEHVHHLPGIRPLVLDAVLRLQPRPALRSTGRLLGPGFAFKRRVIEASGGRALAAEARRRGIPHNPVLLGAYDFGPGDYRARVRGWLAALPAEGGLLFCHPGAGAGDDPADPIGAARARERAYFESRAFMDDLGAADVVLGRVWQTGVGVTVTETSTPG